jgi:hypothetical protein
MPIVVSKWWRTRCRRQAPRLYGSDDRTNQFLLRGVTLCTTGCDGIAASVGRQEVLLYAADMRAFPIV